MQNEEKQLQRLAAQRQLYWTGKRVFRVQMLLSGPLTVALAFLGSFQPEARPTVAAWGILMTLVDLFWLNPWQKRLRDRAARIQEAFDCDVLLLPWNSLKAGQPVEPETEKEQSDLYDLRASKEAPLKDWYPLAVSDLPLPLGRLLCQRANCSWDAAQRRRFATWTLALVLVICVLLLLLSLPGGLRLETFVVRVFAPMLPMLLFGLRQCMEHFDSASRLEKLRTHCEKLWTETLDGLSEGEAAARSRNLQDEILENRRRAPVVLDFAYRWLWRSHEQQMQYAADELAAKAKKHMREKRE
jgi:hypothetical protein